MVCQVRMPEQLRKSLQIHAVKHEKSFSEMVVHFITSNEPGGKAYISINGSKRDAA